MKFHVFDFAITVTRDRRRQSFWQWIKGIPGLNEAYMPTPLPGEKASAWELPACASPDQRTRHRGILDRFRGDVSPEEENNEPLPPVDLLMEEWRAGKRSTSSMRRALSNLSDEQLDEVAGAAGLGSGVFAEIGWRKYRRSQREPQEEGMSL